MLKKAFRRDTNLITNFFVFSEENASDTDFVFEKILNIESLNNINDVIDFESIEYKPIYENIRFDIFFLKYLLKDEIEIIKDYIEKPFDDYTKNVLSLDTSVKSELFEIRDGSDLMTPQLDATLELTRSEINDQKPYVVVDPFVELRKKYPAKSGYPHFYNTFVFPFWDKKDTWTELKYGFNNKTYTYNSFLIIEIYDTYEVEKQKRITTIPVYVSDRYLFKERRTPKVYNLNDEFTNSTETVVETITIEGIEQKRPVFNLSEGVDGYSFFFLKNYVKSDFYAKFYFWDALNGRKIQFIPSEKNNSKKKWLQDVETFDQKKLYLKYELDFSTKTYKIFDLNDKTNEFSIEVDKIDLYEFAYDDYWSNFFVKNEQPLDSTSVKKVEIYNNLLPFKNKIIGPYYLTDTKYLTIRDGVMKQQKVVDIVIGTNYYQATDDYGTYIEEKYVASGNYYGYFFKIANDLHIKTIGLLNIKDIECGTTKIKGSKKQIEPIVLKNINQDKGFLIKGLSLENVTLSSNDKSIDLSRSANLSYSELDSKKGLNFYAETHFLPRTENTRDFNYLTNLYTSAFNFYKENIDTQKNQQNQEIFIDLNQKMFGSMSASDIDLNDVKTKPNEYDNYTSQNLLDKLKTEPLFKEQTFSLTASTINDRLMYEEEMVVSLSFVFGQIALFYSGTIKEMSVTATLVIDYSELNVENPTIEKIRIPININMK